MKEKLTIRNFGPIKNVELELGRFNVLIGEQATGKSTVAKVLAVCRYFSYIVDNIWENKLSEGLEDWGLTESVNDESYIKYECGHYHVELKQEPRNVRTSYQRDVVELEPDFIEINDFVSKIIWKSERFETLLKKVEEISPSEESRYIEESYESLDSDFFRIDVAKVMDNPFYLPTERGLQSIFSLGKSSIQNIADSLFNQFAIMSQIERFFKKDTQIEPLNITYKNVDGKGFIRKNNEEKFYSLYNAASGYKSTIPVVLLMKYYIESKKKSKTFIIEEPELNLFPSAQNEIMKFLGDKIMNYSNSILLTTHSPYILTSLNNLMYAYQLGKENPEKIGKIVENKYWVNPDEVSAYMMLPDGTCEDIFNREESLIRVEKVDGVSRILNEDFDNLINVELGITKPKEASWQD